MSDNNIETAIEATAEKVAIAVPAPAAAVVLSLATYGGVDLTRKVVGRVKAFRANRRAKKDIETVVEATPPAA